MRDWATPPSTPPSTTANPVNQPKVQELVYESPKNYTGPIVEGWPPTKDRSMHLYIRPGENSFRIQPKLKMFGTKILIIVLSGNKFNMYL